MTCLFSPGMISKRRVAVWPLCGAATGIRNLGLNVHLTSMFAVFFYFGAWRKMCNKIASKWWRICFFIGAVIICLSVCFFFTLRWLVVKRTRFTHWFRALFINNERNVILFCHVEWFIVTIKISVARSMRPHLHWHCSF